MMDVRGVLISWETFVMSSVSAFGAHLFIDSLLNAGLDFCSRFFVLLS